MRRQVPVGRIWLCPRLDGRPLTLPRCNIGIGASWRKCLLAMIAMFPLHRRRGCAASRRLGGSRRRVCRGHVQSPALVSVHPAGNFALRRDVEQYPARGRLRSRLDNDNRLEPKAATKAVQRENEHQHEKQNTSKATRCHGPAWLSRRGPASRLFAKGRQRFHRPLRSRSPPPRYSLACPTVRSSAGARSPRAKDAIGRRCGERDGS